MMMHSTSTTLLLFAVPPIALLLLSWCVQKLHRTPLSAPSSASSLDFNRALSGLQFSAFAPDFSPIDVDIAISLGPTCLAAWHIKRGGWRSTPFPLDWVLFDNRETHLSTVASLFKTSFAPLLHLESTSLTYDHDFFLQNGSKITTTLHPQLGMRWIHDDPKADPNRVIERTRILRRRLERARAHDVQLLFVVAWRNNEHPKLATLILQIQHLMQSIDSSVPDAQYKLLVVFEIMPQHPEYRDMRQKLISVDSRVLTTAILPSENEWGNDLAWDHLLKRWRVPRGDDFESCIVKYFSHGYLQKDGFEICVGDKAQQSFSQLDLNNDQMLSLKEFSEVKLKSLKYAQLGN